LLRLRLYDGFEAGLVPAPDVLTQDGEPPKSLGRLIAGVQGGLEQGEDIGPALEELLAALLARPPVDPLAEAVVGQLAGTRAKVRAAAYPAGVVLTARVRPGFFRARDGTGDEDDDATDVDDSSALRAGTHAPAAVGLEEHTDGVA